MKQKTDLQKYQQEIERQLNSIAPVFAKAAIGDFSQNVKIPRHKSELTEFFIGVQLILSAIRDKISQLETSVKDLKAANKLIENEKTRVEAILNSLGDGLITFSKSGRTTFVNDMATKMIGPNASKPGQDINKLLALKHRTGLDISESENPFKIALAKKKQVTSRLNIGTPYYFVNADNVTIRIALTITPIRLDHSFSGAVVIFRDITDEANADRAKSEIVSLASHQLRTPLTTVRWYINELVKHSLTPKKRTQYLAQIQASNQRMIDLVEHLLNVSRIELGTLSLDIEPVNLTEQVDGVIEDLTVRIKEKNLKIIKNFENAPAKVYADKDSLRIILQNLISNAEEYSNENSSIEITVTKQDKHALVKVADKGCGIPADQQYHIFTKLFRATNANNMSTTGSGLGLYISKALIEQMKGKIWFTSKEGVGTTMFITIPLKK
ncbi:MAG TPA: ATP-binding protein [Candidatus Saccharimonadales bacterium]|nr:ATP-binding protein [Candidatus Saccharimonadales bacterium]